MPFLEKQQLMNLTPGHTRDASEKTGGNNSKPAAFKFKLFCDHVVKKKAVDVELVTIQCQKYTL